MNMMAIPLEMFSQKNLDENYSLPHTVDCSPWWISNERKMLQSLSDNITLKLESPPQLYHNVKQFGLQLPDQESSTAQSIGQSLHKVGAVEGQNVQEQCISSESGQDETCGETLEDQMKPVVFFGNPEFIFNPPQVDSSHSMARVSYPYVDPYFGGLYNAYGQQVVNQAQMTSNVVGIAPARVPLPLGLAEDGPIYVNAKQYHGILRRRQSRAKLEAQNKVIRNRKPYLHESRHLHALNRVRGSGGRFLSMKKNQTPDRNQMAHTPGKLVDSINNTNPCQMKDKSTSDCGTMAASCSEITAISNGSVNFRQSDSRKQFSRSFMHGGNQINHASMVQ